MRVHTYNGRLGDGASRYLKNNIENKRERKETKSAQRDGAPISGTRLEWRRQKRCAITIVIVPPAPRDADENVTERELRHS